MTLYLVMTERCNFKCTYCYEGNEKPSDRMSLETARTAINQAVRNLSKDEDLRISLFGGEPLLEFALIKEIVEYAVDMSKKHDFRLSFATTINGSLMNDEIADFFITNKVGVMLSLDGTREAHDINRVTVNNEPTFDSILLNIDNFMRLQRESSIEVRMTVTRNNIGSLSSGLKGIYNLGFKNIGFELVQNDVWTSSDVNVLNNELEDIASFYYDELKQLSGLNISTIDRRIEQFIKPKDRIYCGAGTAFYAVGPNGDLYLCPRLMDEQLVAGHVNDEIPNFSHKCLMLDVDKHDCNGCKYQSFCVPCLAVNYWNNGTFHQEVPMYCQYKKAVVSFSRIIADKLYENERAIFNEKYLYKRVSREMVSENVC